MPAAWPVLILTVAAARLAAACAGALVELTGAVEGVPLSFPAWVYLAEIGAFVLAGTWLLAGGRADRRAVYLGCAFILCASVFTDPLIGRSLLWLDQRGTAGPAWLVSLRPDAFLPLFLWLFVERFPKHSGSGQARAIARAGVLASAVVGTAFFGAWLLAGTSGSSEQVAWAPGVILWLSHDLYWPTVILLTSAALVYALASASSARLGEQRRVHVLVVGLAAGAAPMLVDVLLELLVPAFGGFMRQPGPRLASAFVVFPALLSIPFTMAYAVLVDHVLDVRLVIRRAIQYAFARYTALALVVLPFVVLAAMLFRQRQQPLEMLLSGTSVIAICAVAAVGLLVIRLRHVALQQIDRRFFREHYDARQILTDLIERCRSAATPADLRRLIETEIDRALHLVSATMFTLDPVQIELIAPESRLPPLGCGSALATLLRGSSRPLEVPVNDRDSVMARLPASDRHWLEAVRPELLVPLLASDSTLIGLMALGPKRSELPYSREDRNLLASIAMSASLALENLSLRISPALASRAMARPVDAAGDAEEARAASAAGAECRSCGRVFSSGTSLCDICRMPLAPAPVPRLLAGKFRIEERIGAGGMGVVYRAVDLTLGRSVAIKTLPALSETHAARLRREARAMAAISHPHLAVVFGVETWNALPLLVCELLAGGTLAARLRRQPLTIEETIDLGIALADALSHTHALGVLHRDVKPSNIGYTADGVPKLLDFGLARTIPVPLATDSTTRVPRREADGFLSSEPAAALTASGLLVGTPMYVSPEAVRGLPPDASVDLWSLSLVLYECLTGQNPFAASSIFDTLDRIVRAQVPDLHHLRPGCPELLAAFFRDALAADRARRPPTAAALKARLVAARTSVV